MHADGALDIDSRVGGGIPANSTVIASERDSVTKQVMTLHSQTLAVVVVNTCRVVELGSFWAVIAATIKPARYAPVFGRGRGGADDPGVPFLASSRKPTKLAAVLERVRASWSVLGLLEARAPSRFSSSKSAGEAQK